MVISYLDYATAEVHIIQDVPEDVNIQNYLFGELGLRDSDIYYMWSKEANIIFKNYGRQEEHER